MDYDWDIVVYNPLTNRQYHLLNRSQAARKVCQSQACNDFYLRIAASGPPKEKIDTLWLFNIAMEK